MGLPPEPPARPLVDAWPSHRSMHVRDVGQSPRCRRLCRQGATPCPCRLRAALASNVTVGVPWRPPRSPKRPQPSREFHPYMGPFRRQNRQYPAQSRRSSRTPAQRVPPTWSTLRSTTNDKPQTHRGRRGRGLHETHSDDRPRPRRMDHSPHAGNSRTGISPAVAVATGARHAPPIRWNCGRRNPMLHN